MRRRRRPRLPIGSMMATIPHMGLHAFIKVVFASGTDELNAQLIEKMRDIYPELPLCVVSEFRPADNDIRWIPYRIDRPLRYNLARCRYELRDSPIRLAAVILMPNVPLRRLRLIAMILAPLNLLFFNEELNHFMLRPRSLPSIVRHIVWRARNFVRWQFRTRRDLSPSIAEAPIECPPAVAVYEGRVMRAKTPRVLIATPYLPFPLAHGGAVRMYNLLRRAASSFDQILVAFTESADPPAPELLEICSQVALVRRTGSHLHPDPSLPDVVQEFDSPDFRRALRQAVQQWQPQIAQLEFTQMAQYAADCAPARTILVEHDITFDLYAQLLALSDDWDRREQLELWRKFETAAWRKVDRVVVMSKRDRNSVQGALAAVLPNGVDVERFQRASTNDEEGRLLFIGSFAHLPNVLAIDFFLRDVWPKLRGARLHIIAGSNHEYHLDRSHVKLRLAQPGIEVEGFVTDVRPAYERAAVVIAPLRASAGTNIKILEAMAMAKPIVSTRAGVNGLDLAAGEDFLLADDAGEFTAALNRLLADPQLRSALGANARRRVEREYSWDGIAAAQTQLYEQLLPCARS